MAVGIVSYDNAIPFNGTVARLPLSFQCSWTVSYRRRIRSLCIMRNLCLVVQIRRVDALLALLHANAAMQRRRLTRRRPGRRTSDIRASDLLETQLTAIAALEAIRVCLTESAIAVEQHSDTPMLGLTAWRQALHPATLCPVVAVVANKMWTAILTGSSA